MVTHLQHVGALPAAGGQGAAVEWCVRMVSGSPSSVQGYVLTSVLAMAMMATIVLPRATWALGLCFRRVAPMGAVGVVTPCPAGTARHFRPQGEA